MYLERAIRAATDDQAAVRRPADLVDRAHMAPEGSDECALHAVPQLDRLVKGGTHYPSAIRRELDLHSTSVV